MQVESNPTDVTHKLDSKMKPDIIPVLVALHCFWDAHRHTLMHPRRPLPVTAPRLSWNS